MNRLPELKSFLKDGDALEYKNLEVTFISGRTATLYIYEDGTETEKILISSYKTKSAMHELLKSKGFEKRSPEELATAKQKAKEADEAEELEKEKRRSSLIERLRFRKHKTKKSFEQKRIDSVVNPVPYRTQYTYMFVSAGIILVVFSIGFRRRRKRRSKSRR